MPNSKTILVVYATAGAGHLKAAQAIYNYIADNYKDSKVRIVDILEYSNFVFKRFYSKGYAFLVTKAPFLWGLIYRLSSSQYSANIIRKMNHLISRICSRKFEKLLLEYRPDMVISTHFFPSEMTAALKKRNLLDTNLVTVITDFCVHPFWVSHGVNQYIVACDDTKEELADLGVAPDRIFAYGIPVDLKYSANHNREIVCRKLGIKNDIFTVIVTTSGFGLNPIKKIANILQRHFQLLIICGRNEKLFRELEAKKYKNVKLFAFIDNLEELMACSDLAITKPGGLTIAECLAMDLPFLFISAIPGQEKANIQILRKYALGGEIKDLPALSNIVYGYKNNPERLKIIKEKILRLKKPYAVKEIVNAIC